MLMREKRRAYALSKRDAYRMQGKSYKDRAGMRDYCSVEIMNKNRMGLPEILSLASSTTSIAAMVANS